MIEEEMYGEYAVDMRSVESNMINGLFFVLTIQYRPDGGKCNAIL